MPRIAEQGRAVVSISGSTLLWGEKGYPSGPLITPTGSGGRYRLCWCRSPFPCSTTEDFSYDFGHLDVAPARATHQT